MHVNGSDSEMAPEKASKGCTILVVDDAIANLG